LSGEDPLAIDVEAMRQMGYRTVDMLVDQIADPRAKPCLRRATPEDMERRLAGPPPNDPRDFEDVLEQVERDVLSYKGRTDHPGYFAFIPTGGTFPGALGDLIASALSIYVGSWMEAAGPTQLELTVIDWFKDWIGYPHEAAGILVGGGSAANLTALACARESLLGAMTDRVVAYVSDMAHSSVARGARALGFRPDQVRVLPCDERFRLRPDALTGAIEADLAAGRQPLFVSAAAGATSTGAIDPLPELSSICRDNGMWLHADAAYGGFAVLSERGKRWLEGLELCDSVTLDPHKWLYQSYECGSLLVRDGRLLRRAFEIVPDYLKDAQAASEVNFTDLGLQLSRTSRALKVWMSINCFGLEAFREAVDRSLDLVRGAQDTIRESDTLELTSPAQLGVLTFRRHVDGAGEEELERLNSALVGAWEQTGHGLVSSTRLRGRYVVRLCVMNHASQAEDVERVLDFFATSGPLEAGSHRRPPVSWHHRHPPVEVGWLGGRLFEPEEIAGLPLFEGLSAEQLAQVAQWSREVRAEAGAAVIRRWEGARDFYVIVEGAVSVTREEEVLAELGPGDFFGELAALDWGAGFGYARLASVSATAPLRLLVLSPALLAQLMRESPGVNRRIQTAVRERLPSL
jgi:glutamate/tyrosine decarboxylase-like PLP-dependent enzyme